MTRMCAGGSGHRTISRPRGLSRSFAQCPCVLTRDGIRSSLIFQTSPAAHTELITLKLFASRSTRTVAFAASTFPIVSTPKKNCPRNSSSSSPSRSTVQRLSNNKLEGRNPHQNLSSYRKNLNSKKAETYLCVVYLFSVRIIIIPVVYIPLLR